jgi:hypothetical protein
VSLARSLESTLHPTLARRVVASVDQVLDGHAENAGNRDERGRTRSGLFPASDLSSVPIGEPGKAVDLVAALRAGEGDEGGKSGGEGVLVGHVGQRTYVAARSYVKAPGDFGNQVAETPGMASRREGPRSPVAERIRARIREMGASETSFSEKLGQSGKQLSTQLRRLDDGGNLRSDTLAKLSAALGKSEHWIMTGRDPETTPLSLDPRWKEAAEEAARVYRVSPRSIVAVGEHRPPAPPKNLDGAYILLMSKADEYGA